MPSVPDELRITIFHGDQPFSIIGKICAMRHLWEMAGNSNKTGEMLTLPHLVKWVEMVTKARAEKAIQEMDISGSQLFVLVLLNEKTNATSADLARMMCITPQALTTLIGPLRKDGYIARRADQDHGRRLLLSLTEKGHDIIAQARKHGPEVEEDLLADFTEQERMQLKQYLSRIARKF